MGSEVGLGVRRPGCRTKECVNLEADVLARMLPDKTIRGLIFSGAYWRSRYLWRALDHFSST